MTTFFSTLIYFLNFITILEITFSRKKNTQSTIAWVLILTVIPLGGFIAYNLIGRGLYKNRRFNLKKTEDQVFKHKFLINQKPNNSITTSKNSLVENNRATIDMFSGIGDTAFTEGNDVSLYTDSDSFFNSLKMELRNAEKSINIQFYIFKDDNIGNEILSILNEKAKEGVSVKILYDAMGSRWLKHQSIQDIINNGGKAAAFLPSKIKLLNRNFNYRNHRKIVVIDDKVGFIGGFNIGDEYMGRYKKFGTWRDTHTKILGPAVKFINLRFLQDWRFASGEDLNLTSYIQKHVEPCGDVCMQIVSSGPDTPEEQIKYGYISLIQNAKKYIFIQSPYFILDQSLYEALKLAIYRGVDVRIMIPAKPDHPFVYWASYFNAGELIKVGAKVYTYSQDAFLHAKTVVVDDEVCSIGTANFDIRSFALNFEINAFMYSERIALLQRQAFENDMLISKEVTPEIYINRGTVIRIKESISRLLSPIL